MGERIAGIHKSALGWQGLRKTMPAAAFAAGVIGLFAMGIVELPVPITPIAVGHGVACLAGLFWKITRNVPFRFLAFAFVALTFGVLAYGVFGENVKTRYSHEQPQIYDSKITF